MPEVAAQVMDCVRRAQARIPDLLRQTMTEVVGTADPNTHLLVDDARRRFPEPPPPPPEPRAWQPDEVRFTVQESPAPARPAATPPRPRRTVVEEQWDEERPVLKEV